MAKTNNKTKVGVVLPNLLNVREKPNGKIVGLLKSKTIVEILSDKNGWLKIKHFGAHAWVNGSFVEIKEDAE